MKGIGAIISAIYVTKCNGPQLVREDLYYVLKFQSSMISYIPIQFLLVASILGSAPQMRSLDCADVQADLRF